jgi:putative ABC transport system substrate-binding protein
VRRREFITLLGGATVAWPVAAGAQQPDRVRRIGILMYLASDDADAQSRNAAFLQGLQELGWAVGRNVRIDYRWGASNFDPERMRKGAVELVALAPDVVLATTVPIVLALQQVSRTVPIVFAAAIDWLQNRLRQLNNVVFPAPFGPIRPKIVPGSISKLTPSSATIPSN